MGFERGRFQVLYQQRHADPEIRDGEDTEMMFNVALMQLAPAGSVAANVKKAVTECECLRNEDIDVFLFPEMWTVGYTFKSFEEMYEDAVSEDDDIMKRFAALARELNKAVGITALEKHEGKLRNTLYLYDRHGELVLKYSKVHTCDFDDECILEPGDDFYVTDLDTEKGSVKVGAMICYDREFPESARILMLKGAEIILVPNACPMEINRLGQLRGRAYENMVGIATANYPNDKEDCNGHSNAFDGVAHLEDMPGSRDMKILEAPEEEGIYIARFDMDMIREYRKQEVHGNAYRRPEKYGLLTDKTINEPFIRNDRRK